MASVIITIEIDNSAFVDGQAPAEIKRIVSKIPFYQDATEDDMLVIDGSSKLRDSNGNTVGNVVIQNYEE